MECVFQLPHLECYTSSELLSKFLVELLRLGQSDSNDLLCALDIPLNLLFCSQVEMVLR